MIGESVCDRNKYFKGCTVAIPNTSESGTKIIARSQEVVFSITVSSTSRVKRSGRLSHEMVV